MNVGGFVVFSAYQGRDAHLDVQDTLALQRHLDKEGIPNLKVWGKYAGKSEVSFVVDQRYLDKALNIAADCNQECVLLVEDNFDAFLVVHGSKELGTVVKQYLGHWTEIEDPKGHDHTTNQYSGRHYIIV